MKFDARKDNDDLKRIEFKDWLTKETVNDLKRSEGKPEELKSCIFLFLNRAYEAHLDPDEIVNMLGVDQTSILELANLEGADEQIVLKSYELLDSTISQVHE
jgi:hypothetical protein